LSIIKLNESNFQNYIIRTRPHRRYVSGSDGIEGDVQLFVDASPRLKDLDPTFSDEPYDGANIEDVLNNIIVTPWEGNQINGLESYLAAVNEHPQGERQLKRQEILRYEPGVKLDKNFLSKRIIKEVLFPFYRNVYASLQWAFTNYQCFNFFDGDNVDSEAALIYPGVDPNDVQAQNLYVPNDDFTISFWIKPKNQRKDIDAEIKPGTVLHAHSNFAISVVTGSSKGNDGFADKYRLLMQFGPSSLTPPNEFDTSSDDPTSSGDDQFAWMTSDNSLLEGHWNHVCIRWPGPSYNDGLGTVHINGIKDSEFGEISTSPFDPSNSYALFIGNFYDAFNSGASDARNFFNSAAASREGVTQINSPFDEDPSSYVMNHPLNAELFDVRIYDDYIKDSIILDVLRKGPTNLSGLLFYLPVLFVRDTRLRKILQTPFQETDGSTEDPFNVSVSFSVGGYDPNTENFVKDFARKEFPRLWKIFSRTIDDQVDAEGITANDLLYKDLDLGVVVTSPVENRRKLYTVLPCDNGLFTPNHALIESETNNTVRFNDSFGNVRLDLVNLDDLVSTDGLLFGPQTLSNLNSAGGSTLFPELEGASPEDPSVAPGVALTVLRRTGDPSSNEIVIFDISNMFYGDRIEPGSLIMIDEDPAYLTGEFGFVLKDDGQGRIYRADTKSKVATWNCVGNVLYDEGLIVIKSPMLRFFGKNGYTIEFRGDRNVYVLEVSVPLEMNQHNVSNNPTYRDLRPNANFNENAERFTYVTGVQLHDDNLNVVARANLAQPVIKKDNDRYVIKLRIDF
jgi:hypothetical protein